MPANHQKERSWADEVTTLTQPDRVHWFDGSQPNGTNWHRKRLHQVLWFGRMSERNLTPLSSYGPADVARVEDRTFIGFHSPEDAEPTNNRVDPDQMKSIMIDRYRGCMRGRSMYVIPSCMGSPDAKRPMFGLEITDSAYVVMSMRV